MDVGILILRLVVGLTIAAHGAQKLFGWFGGTGFSGTAKGLEQMGFRPGRLHAGLSGLAELGGGLLLAIGLATPLGAAAVIGSMVAAIATIHWRNGFFNGSGGYEFNVALAAGALAIAFAGPGGMSVDSALGWELAGTGWGVGSAALGVATAAAVIAGRRRPKLEEAAAEVPGKAA